jgi:hypothetical protein
MGLAVGIRWPNSPSARTPGVKHQVELVNTCCRVFSGHQCSPMAILTSGNRRDHGVGNGCCPCVVRSCDNYLYLLQGRAERAVRLAARVGLGSLPRSDIGVNWVARLAGGRGAPAGLSPLPVRPLRPSPRTATAGGGQPRPRAPARISWPPSRPPNRGPRRTPRHPPALQREAAKFHCQWPVEAFPSRR